MNGSSPVCRLLEVSGVFVGAGQKRAKPSHRNSWGSRVVETLFVQCLTEGSWRYGCGSLKERSVSRGNRQTVIESNKQVLYVGRDAHGYKLKLIKVKLRGKKLGSSGI